MNHSKNFKSDGTNIWDLITNGFYNIMTETPPEEWTQQQDYAIEVRLRVPETVAVTLKALMGEMDQRLDFKEGSDSNLMFSEYLLQLILYGLIHETEKREG